MALATTSGSSGRGILLGILLLVGLLLLYGSYVVGRTWLNERALQGQGQVVQAQVVSSGTAPGPRSIGLTYGLTYRLPGSVDPAGQEHHATVSEEVYRAALASGQVPVQVLPGNAGVQKVVGASGNGSSRFWIMVFDVLYLLFVVALLRQRS